MKLNELGRQELAQPTFWQQVKHAWLCSDLLQFLNEKVNGSAFEAEDTLISASVVPRCVKGALKL